MYELEDLKNDLIISVERHSDSVICIKTEDGYSLDVQCSGREELYLGYDGELETLIGSKILNIESVE